MCGICGVYGFDDPKLVKEMTKILEHRGPDDYGHLFDDKVGLGHRRLSIIDLSTGRQPIYNEDKSIGIVFNGEIYNFKDLREGLERKGHRFSTETDTETILHLYEEKGVRCLDDLNGFFAFAIWDSEKKKLFIARDRAGIKQLYYTLVDGKLLFASEIKALLLHESVKREVNISSLDSYITYRYIPGKGTLFEGIYKLRPGEAILADGQGIKIKRYWRFRIDEDISVTHAAYAKQLRKLLKDSVQKRMISDVPVGAYLSGGLDSSAIVNYMVQNTDEQVKTFALGFEGGKDVDETKNARQVAEHLGTDHHEISVPKGAAKLLPKIIWHLDDPLGDTAIVANYLLAERARKDVTVVLSGEGADELFGGYMQHKYMLLAGKIKKLMPRFAARTITPAILKTLPPNVIDKFVHYPANIGKKGKKRSIELVRSVHDDPKTYTQLISFFTESDKTKAYSDNLKSKVSIGHVRNDIRTSFRDSHQRNILNQVLHHEFNTWLPDDILFKLDKISMANSLEGRVPFLDHRIIKLSAKMPASIKIKGMQEKYILRKAMIKDLPKQVYQRKKHAFYMPVTNWFDKEILDISEDLLDPKQIRKRGYFNNSYVKKIVSGYNKEFLYEKQLISLIVLEMWHRIFIDGSIEKIRKSPKYADIF